MQLQDYNCIIYYFLVYTSSSSDDDDKTGQNDESITNQLKNCTKIVNEVGMYQMAYIKACADRKSLDLNMYKSKTTKDMSSKLSTCKSLSKDKGTGINNFNPS